MKQLLKVNTQKLSLQAAETPSKSTVEFTSFQLIQVFKRHYMYDIPSLDVHNRDLPVHFLWSG